MRSSAAILALSGLLPLAVIASCADSDPGTSPDGTDGGTDSAIPVVPDANADAAPSTCDAGDKTCTSQVLPCNTTDFCPVATTIDPRYALNGVWAGSPTDVWIVGGGGTLAHLEGATFVVEPPLTAYTLNAIWGSSADNLWAVSTPDVILHRGADKTWTKAAPIETRVGVIQNVILHAVWGPRDGSGVYVAGEAMPRQPGWEVPPHDQVWKSPFGELAWSRSSELDYYAVHGIWGSAPDDLWTVGIQRGGPSGAGMAFHSIKAAKGGIEGWAPTDFQSANPLQALWGSGPNDVWAVGTQGTIRHWTGGSKRWDVVESPTKEDLHAVWGAGPNDVWIVGDHGTILRWEGTAWRHLVASFPVGRNPNLYGIAGTSETDVWAVGESGTVLHSTGTRTPEVPK